MKADRLISILMLLQIHKQLTASELADKLEVSVRTIYRDIDSLSNLNIPIFSDRGSGGGIKLLGDFETSLNNINTNEIYSLFIPAGDKVLEDLGIEKLKSSTLLKLLAKSSPTQRKEIENIQNFIYIDMNTWGVNPTSINKDILSLLQISIWNSQILKMIYRKVNETKEVILKPLGIVCKRGVWYLIGINNEIIKTYKVSSIDNVSLCDQTFLRPHNFNLENYWLSSTKDFKSKIPKYKFKFKITPSIFNYIKERKFIAIDSYEIKNDEIYIDISFDAYFQGIEFAFGYGKDLIVLEPESAIEDLKKKAKEILALY